MAKAHEYQSFVDQFLMNKQKNFALDTKSFKKIIIKEKVLF